MSDETSRRDLWNFSFRPLLSGLAGFSAGLLLFTWDFCRLAPRKPEDFDALAVLLARLLAFATVLGLLLVLVGPVLHLLRRLTAAFGRRGELAVAFILSLIALPWTLYLCRSSLVGAGISQHAQIALIRLAAPVLLSLGLVLAFRIALMVETWLRPGAWQRGVACGSLLLGVTYLLDRADARLYVGLYPQIHQSLFALSYLSAYFGFATLLRPIQSLRLTSLLVALLVTGLFWNAWITGASPHSRFLLIKKTLQGPRVVRLWKILRPSEESFRDAIVADADFAARRRDAQGQREALRSELDRFLGEHRPRHLIWITVDTLRRDALGFMGRERPVSPRIDALASESLILERHQAQFPITSFSFQSAFFSRYPSATPLFRQMIGQAENPKGVRSLAEVLTAAGFRTVSIPAIATRSLEVPAYAALAQGFEEIDPGAPENRPREAPMQVAAAEQVLEQRDDRRLFLWLHFMDPHESYVAHPQHNFGTDKRARYDSEIAFVDAAIGRLIDKIAALGLRDETMIVFNSDHGEAFGDHDTTFHGTTLYEEQIAVPAFIHLPGTEPSRVNLPTANIDLSPTILDLLGVESDALIQGQSLAGYFIPDLDDLLLPLPFSFAEIPDAIPQMAPANRDRQALVNGPYKLIANGHDDFVELYDLKSDPKESINLASRRPEVVARMLGMIRVIQQESEFINVPQSERSDESFYSALQESLRSGPIPTRCRLIEEHIDDKNDAMRAILVERLNDPLEHELIKLLILRRGRELLGEDYLGHIRAMLKTGRALGTVASVLDLWLEHNLGVSEEDQGFMAGLLLKHPQLGWRAARILARLGDQRARLQLEPAMAMSEFRVSFRSACSLGLLGEATAEPVILAGLLSASRDPDAFALALEALQNLKSDKALLVTISILRDRYVHHRLKTAALKYFASIPGDLALAGFIQLSNGWDPEVGKQIKMILEKRLGGDAARVILRAGTLREDILELTEMGRFEAAEIKCREVIESLPSAEASFMFRLLRARLLLQLGRQEEAVDVLESLQSAELPASIEVFAHALKTRGLPESYQVELLELAPLASGPLVAGREVLFRVRLRNASTEVIPGGGDWQSPNFRLLTKSGEVAGQDFVTSLPSPGLAPGQEMDIHVRFSLPGTQSAYQLELRAFRVDGGAIEISDRRSRVKSWPVAAADSPGLDPQNLTFKGTQIRDQWLINPAFDAGVLMADGSVAYLANELDPILMSPYLKDCKKALEVSVQFRAEAAIAGTRSEFEFFWRYEQQPHFLPQQHHQQTIQLDGKSQVLKFRVEAEKSRSVRQLRFDFFQEPELVSIEKIEIRSVD